MRKLVDIEVLKQVRERFQQKIENGQIVAGQALTSKAINPISEESGTIQENPFIIQGTGTNNNISLVDTSPVGKQLEKQGNTIVYNQLCENWNFNSTSNVFANDPRFSLSVANNMATFTATSEVGDTTQKQVGHVRSQSIGNGHKVLIRFLARTSKAGVSISNIASGQSASFNPVTLTKPNTDYTISAIATAPADNTYIYETGMEVGDALSISKFIFIDLTKWFNGDIPQDILDHPEHFSWHYNGDISYNEGELKNSTGRYLVCGQSRNVYNPDEVYNRVIPNTEYYYYSSFATATTITYYDNNRSVILAESVNSGSIFTTPSNCAYINSSVTSNITISLYYLTGDGYDKYYPYVPPVIYDTGSEILRKAGSVKDTKTPDGIITRRIGYVNLGDFDWIDNNGVWQTATALSNVKTADYYEVPNALCSKYEVRAFSNQSGDEPYLELYNGFGGRIRIKDTTYTDAALFKSSLSGVVLYYEYETLMDIYIQRWHSICYSLRRSPARSQDILSC